MNIKMIEFEIHGDENGSLIALEENKNIPFEIKRVYYIFGTKKSVIRGRHAHKKLKQVAVCISGSCRVLLDDGNKKEEILLDSPNKGLIINEMIWREMYDFSEDCVLMILASELYDENDYIREYYRYKKGLKS